MASFPCVSSPSFQEPLLVEKMSLDAFVFFELKLRSKLRFRFTTDTGIHLYFNRKSCNANESI